MKLAGPSSQAMAAAMVKTTRITGRALKRAARRLKARTATPPITAPVSPADAACAAPATNPGESGAGENRGIPDRKSYELNERQDGRAEHSETRLKIRQGAHEPSIAPDDDDDDPGDPTTDFGAAEQSETSLKIRKGRGRGLAKKTIDMIHAMHRICEERQPITVRGVAYALFVLKLISSMAVACTQKVSRLLVYAREQSIIPWTWIVDESRELEEYATWDNPDEFLDQFSRNYRLNFWNQQPFRVQVWSEKGTVRGLLGPVIDEYGTPFFNVHGFNSATKVMDVAKDPNRHPMMVFYVGDYDPSGLYMSVKDLPERLEQYAQLAGYEGSHIEIRRIALLREHCTEALPSFSAGDKTEDKRFRWFITNYGDPRDLPNLERPQKEWERMEWVTRLWELDAMDPRELRSLVENAIRSMIDWDTWHRCAISEKAQRDSMKHGIEQWRSALRGDGGAAEQSETSLKIVPPPPQGSGLWMHDL
jgi:hypothetical protein